MISSASKTPTSVLEGVVTRSACTRIQRDQWHRPSCFQRSPYRVDNAILRRRIEIGMHRQAYDLGCEAIANGYAALAHRIMLISLLAMQWDRIIDCGRNSFRFEHRRNRITPAIGDANCVLCPN